MLGLRRMSDRFADDDDESEAAAVKGTRVWIPKSSARQLVNNIRATTVGGMSKASSPPKVVETQHVQGEKKFQKAKRSGVLFLHQNNARLGGVRGKAVL
jgi:hypothetical protein